MRDVVTSSALRALLLSSSGQPLLQQRKECSHARPLRKRAAPPQKCPNAVGKPNLDPASKKSHFALPPRSDREEEEWGLLF